VVKRSSASKLAECRTGQRLPVVYPDGTTVDSDDLHSLGNLDFERPWQANDAPSSVWGRGVRRILGL